MNSSDKIEKIRLKKNLLRLDKKQLKLFYGILVHAWASKKAFISTRHFFNLWCELNYLCHEFDESFPEPYDDRELLRSFWHTHPYYFIDTLPSVLVIRLFCKHFDDRLDVLATIANKLATESLRASYEYSKEALGLSENIDELVAQAEEHVNMFS